MSAQPRLQLAHLLRLLDDTGIAQHATYAVVARAHGYCLDDNARGLLLAMGLYKAGVNRAEADMLFARTASFIQHAWNEEAGRFRNFMGYDRQWLEQAGSEDSHGRTIWVLGVAIRDAPDDDVRLWARELLDRAMEALSRFTSPRALAYGLLGLSACQSAADSPDLSYLRGKLAGRLLGHLRENRAPDWVWYENSLSYDNARLPQAMLAAGQVDSRQDWLAAGIDTLRWLCRAQTSAGGQFSPMGSDGGWIRGGHRARFDQQPIEASASVAAALLAWRICGEASWLAEAERAHAWFLGANGLGQPLVVTATGACRDGLHPDRVNANQGAESTLAWLQADLDLAKVESVAAPALLKQVTGG